MLTTSRLNWRNGLLHDGADPAAPAPAPAPTGPPAGYVPQDEVTRIATREKEEGRRSAEKALSEQLGVTVEEAKQIIADARARDDAEKTEAQKAQQRAEAAEKKAAALAEDATKQGHEARVKLALLDSGVIRERLDAAARLVEADTGADDKALAAAVEAAKTAAPEFFSQAGGEEPPKPGEPPKPATPPTPSDPPGTPPKPTTGEGAYERGAGMAKARAGSSQYPILEQT